MQITITYLQDVPVLSLNGRLDHKGASILEDALSTLPGTPSHVVLDLRGVDYLSSMGIRSLVKWEKALKQKAGGILLCAVTPGISQILRIAGLLSLFRVFDDMEAALGFLQDASGPATLQTFVRNNRTYNIACHPEHKSCFDLWGDGQEDEPAPMPVTLDELGMGLGVAGLGSTAADAAKVLGAYVSTGKSAAVVPADSHFHPDWLLGHNPAESILFVRHGVTITGSPAFTVDVRSDEPFSCQAVLEDVREHVFGHISKTSPKPITRAGFVAFGQAVEVLGRHFQDAAEMSQNAPGGACRFTKCRLFAAGIIQSGDGKENSTGQRFLSKFLRNNTVSGKPPENGCWTANALVFDALAEVEIGKPEEINHLIGLETLGGVCRLDPDSRCASLRLWLYLPEAIRSGEEKRLRIETRSTKTLSHAAEIIARRIYRDAARMIIEPLAGGFSADTYLVHSYDAQERELLPTVLKIGGKDWIDREISAYHDHVQKFILNNSTTILGAAEHGDTAGLRYNFLGITGAGGKLAMLRDLYARLPVQDLQSIFVRVFTSILKPWYGQPRWEILRPFVEHDPRRLFKNICEDAESALGIRADQETLACPILGRDLPNPYHFLQHGYARRAEKSMRWYTSIIHGDLNLANILLDDNDNLYVIDFSETRQGNIVSDLARLEVIACLGMTRIEDEADLRRVVLFAQALAQNETIDHTPDYDCSQDDPLLGKAHALVRVLRGLAGKMTIFEDDPVPYYLAMMEWILPIVSYWDTTVLRKQASAYCAAILAERIMDREKQTK